MGSLFRRSLKNDAVRSGVYLVLGLVLFLFAGATFMTALRGARGDDAAPTPRPGTQTPAPPPERYVPPAPVEYPFF